MIQSSLLKKDDNTIEIKVTIPWHEVKKTMDKIVDETTKQAKVAGFRKGKAPKKLIEDQIDKNNVKEEALKNLLPTYYIKAVEEHKLTPVMNPKIHIAKLDEEKDWEFTAITAEAPKVKLNNYKEKVKAVTAKSKIVLPGKEPTPAKLDDIIAEVLKSAEVTIPSILIEQESERLLAQMLDEIKRLGLTLDQYLASTGKSPEQLRNEYAKKAEADIKLEFVMQKIAEEEKITVEQKEIDEAIQKAKDEEERKHLDANRYLLTSILRQQKTLDFLRNL